MIFIANVFPKLQTVKVFFIPLSKKRCFRTRFDGEHMKDLSCFFSFSGKLIWIISSLVLGEILGVFVNTLTADVKYPVQGCENLQVPIQMQLSEKGKTFSEFFV